MQTETQSDKPRNGENGLETRAEIEDRGGCKRWVKATVPADKIEAELARNYRDLADSVQIPGFRRGRVPRQLLEARFGKEVEKEVKSSILHASFGEVVEEHSLDVLTPPKFDSGDFKKDSDFEYEAEFEVRPVFDLGSYKGVSVTMPAPPDVTDEQVDEEIERLRQREAALEPTDLATAGPDDFIVGRYVLIRDDVEVKSVDRVRIKPSSRVVDSFLVEGLEDKFKAWDRTGEEPLTVSVKVPQTYSDEVLRGEDVELRFTAEDAYQIRLPEIDDELATRVGAETMDELRQQYRELLESRNKTEWERSVEEKILDELAARTRIDIPEGLVDAQLRRQQSDREYQLLQHGFTPEQVKEMLAEESAKPESAEAEAKNTEDIQRSTKKYFILEKIAEAEKVFATEDDVERRILELATYNGVSPDRVRTEIENTGRMEEILQSLRHEKVRAFLREKSEVKEGEESTEDRKETTGAGGVDDVEGGAGETIGAESSEDSRAAGTEEIDD